MDLHDLTAAYALDALDADETEAYERHLGQCEQCRTQLAELNEAAAALAFGGAAPAPPARLRSVILETAAAERANVVPFVRRRWVARGLAVTAAAAACAAVGLIVASTRSSTVRVITASVVVGPNRTATLEVSGLPAAPRGETYEAWVIPAGGRPRPSGLFAGGGATALRLPGSMPQAAVVAVTLERAGGVSSPTTTPLVRTPVERT
jgi:anti-sigma-K factor RskA